MPVCKLPDAEIFYEDIGLLRGAGMQEGGHNPHMVGEHAAPIDKAIPSFLEKQAFQEKMEGILPVV